MGALRQSIAESLVAWEVIVIVILELPSHFILFFWHVLDCNGHVGSIIIKLVMTQHIKQAIFWEAQKKSPVGFLGASPHHSFSLQFFRSRLMEKRKPKRSRPNGHRGWLRVHSQVE
jgi:hypothetical protein